MNVAIQYENKSYYLECVSSVQELEALESDWLRLEQACPEPYTYFQSFNWCLNWCRVYLADSSTPDTKPQIFVLRDEQQVVLIWPLMETRRAFSVKILTSLSEPLGQYSHVIYDQNRVSAGLAQSVWETVQGIVKVDAVTLNRFSPNSLLAKALGDEGVSEQSELYASVMDLDSLESWDQHLASLTGKQRKDRKRRRKKLEKQGEVTYHVYLGGCEQYEAAVRQAVDWKLDWLRRTGRQESVLSSSFFCDFLARLSGDDASGLNGPEGALCGVLTVDDQPVAIELGACLGGHYYSFLGAFDWNFRPYSVGKIQIEEHQKWAKLAGVRKFDFLGDPAEYKGSWVSTTDSLECRSFPQSPFGYLYCVVWKARLRPQLRKVFHQLGDSGRVKLMRWITFSRKTSSSSNA